MKILTVKLQIIAEYRINHATTINKCDTFTTPDNNSFITHTTLKMGIQSFVKLMSETLIEYVKNVGNKLIIIKGME